MFMFTVSIQFAIIIKLLLLLLWCNIAFKCNIACPSTIDSVGLRIATRSIRDFYTFSVHRNFKASPFTRCASAANGVFWNKDRILLLHII
jgi:hypothetical protein